METIVETIRLTKEYRDFWGRVKVRAVDGLNFAVRRGEIYGLLGPNGSGKTTTIKLLLGLLFPTTGKVAVFGRSPRDVQIKHRIGFLPEESYLYLYQNAEEALHFYARLFGLPRALRKQRVENLLEMVGLTKARRRPLKEYSKGMARRIGLAQALINDPELIILDEPTSGLDPLGTREIKDLILQLKEHRKTVLLSSHLLADVEDVCDRIAILYGGQLCVDGPVTDLLAQKESMQITLPCLKAEVLARLRATLAEAGIDEITVGTPTKRLEHFFLQAVERARQAQRPTGGAEPGKRLEGFFSIVPAQLMAEPQPNQIITQLMAEPQPLPSLPHPASPLPPPETVDQHFLQQLTRAKESVSEPVQIMAESAGVRPAQFPSTPPTSVDRQVLERLLASQQKPTEDRE